MERSPWSDIVFMEAMCKNNFISKEGMYCYLKLRNGEKKKPLQFLKNHTKTEKHIQLNVV